MTPPIALTMGDPSGIGPEIALKAWERLRGADAPFILIADPGLMRETASRLGLPEPRECAASDAAGIFSDTLPVLPVTLGAAAKPGQPNAANAGAILDSIREAVRLTTDGAASAVVTNPISKAALYGAGFGFPGHTEFLADLTQDLPQADPPGPVMMLACPALRCVLVSIHTPLSEAVRSLTTERIVHTAMVAHAALRRDFGIAKPRLALAGLNPHAGEGGALGREEIEIVNPAAEALRAAGIDITDAQPPDAMFRPEARASYDAAVCMYHDQGLIPVKALDFDGGVNVTLGLPIVRASPDHGTGFDIAGNGKASPASLIAALTMASKMAARRSATAGN